MPLIKSEYGCPICKRAGVKSQIFANLGELLCEKDGTHKWSDTQSFYAEQPTMDFALSKPQALPQQNYVNAQLSVPPGLIDTLRAKYGDKTEATMVSILMQMVEGDILIVGQTDLDRIASRLGKVPENSSELYGMIYAKTEEVLEAKQMAEAAAADLKAYEGLSPGRVVVDLGDQFAEAKVRAANAEPPEPLAYWVAKKIRDGIRDNWF
jgi:hypothetical protein